MTEPNVEPTDEQIMEWVMGDEWSSTRMRTAAEGPAGNARRDLFRPIVDDLWGRRVLPVRTMALTNLAILACLNRPHELLTRTVGLLRGGISVEEIEEVLLHVSFYAGNPAGVEATVTLHEAIEHLTEQGVAFNLTHVD